MNNTTDYYNFFDDIDFDDPYKIEIVNIKVDKNADSDIQSVSKDHEVVQICNHLRFDIFFVNMFLIWFFAFLSAFVVYLPFMTRMKTQITLETFFEYTGITWGGPRWSKPV